MGKDLQKRTKLDMPKSPEGLEGPGFFATKLEDVIGLARANSLWPLPFATSCCGIEFMATMASNYDLARFGSERLSFSPRQADMLMVMGTPDIKNFLKYCLTHDDLTTSIQCETDNYMVIVYGKKWKQ